MRPFKGIREPEQFYDAVVTGAGIGGLICANLLQRAGLRALLIEQQSQELDPQKRLALVQEIQKKLEEAATRPAIAWRLDYFAHRPYVKNLIPHHSLYGWGRMQDVWRDR